MSALTAAGCEAAPLPSQSCSLETKGQTPPSQFCQCTDVKHKHESTSVWWSLWFSPFLAVLLAASILCWDGKQDWAQGKCCWVDQQYMSPLGFVKPEQKREFMLGHHMNLLSSHPERCVGLMIWRRNTANLVEPRPRATVSWAATLSLHLPFTRQSGEQLSQL